jgi:ElaB/YqjD/DUF883 family membrane-anchored ribosome-binding protein
MIRDEQINYLRIALGLQKIVVDNEIADRIIETYEKILKLKGKFSVMDAVEIEMRIDKKYKDSQVKAQKKSNS